MERIYRTRARPDGCAAAMAAMAGNLEPTRGIEPRTPSLRVVPDHACDGDLASIEANAVPHSPLFRTGMLAGLLAGEMTQEDRIRL